jgi:hypothetical protein
MDSLNFRLIMLGVLLLAGILTALIQGLSGLLGYINGLFVLVALNVIRRMVVSDAE